jgi:hypothetical protein
MPPSVTSTWKRSLVKAWVPVAAVVGALKVLLFDVPEIYHKISENVSLSLTEQVMSVAWQALKYSGVVIFLLTCFFSSENKKDGLFLRIVGLLLSGVFLWFVPDAVNAVAVGGWLLTIGVVIDLFMNSPSQDQRSNP